MTIQPRHTIPSLLVPLLLLGGCGSPGETSELAFQAIGDQAPTDTVTLGVADDIDPVAPGIQVAVRVRTSSPVVLHVGDQTYQADPDDSGTAIFTAVSLRAGENALVAQDASGARAAAVARVNAPALSISGDDGHILGCGADDRDPSADGVQTVLVVLAPNVPESTPISVWIGQDRFDGAVSQGKAIVPITLPARSGTFTARAEASLGTLSLSDERTLAMQCAGCELSSIGDISLAAAPTEPVLVGPAHDEDAAPGMQASLVARAEGLPGTAVTLRVNGEEVATVSPDGEGRAHFDDVTLPDQATVELVCAVDGARAESSRTQVRFDDTPPPAVEDLVCALHGDWVTCCWTQPEDPDDVGPLSAWSLRYVSAPDMTPADWADAVVVGGVPSPENDNIPMVAMFPLDTSLHGPMTLALQCQDAAGNTSALSNHVTLHP